MRAHGDIANAPARKGELLLELLSEEIPARMQRAALADLCALLRDKLAAAEIPAVSLAGYVTPRRLAVAALGIPLRQPDRREERRGPRVGAPQAALDGFLRAAGLAALADCEVRDTGRGEFYFALIDRPGRAAAEVLPALIRAAMAELPWPKSMRFPAAPLRWVRPLTSVVCLFDGAIVPLDLGRVPVGRATRGHRFLAPGDIVVGSAAEYRDRLEKAFVVLDHDRRKTMIAADLDRLAAAAGIRVKPDPGLLDEVAGLVEFPVTLLGAIDPAVMSLPPEVLTAAMRMHQKYFSCAYPDGSAAPHFLLVANMLAADGGKAIVAGNERVLRARLADARFFWDQDRKVPLAARVAALKGRIYHEKLGSVFDKVERMETLARILAADFVPDADETRSRRAAFLAKADLSTGMVGEFPELQGVIGRYYALADGEDPRVAQAIAEHYKPLGPTDTCPTAPDSIVVALADKIDALASFFAVGEKPSGSRDPFALRRAAQGIIRIALENKRRMALKPLFIVGANFFAINAEKTADELLDFVADRLKVHLREQGVRHDLIAAVFALGEDDLVRLLARVEALREFLDTEDGANLLVAYRRAANIVAIEEKRDGRRYDGPVDATLFRQPEEAKLYCRLNEMGALEGRLAHERFDLAMAELATLRRPVDEFFAKVTVNAVESELRENRLRLLSRIRATMNRVADFSQIEG
ncbi:MAG TPA: glycine--tRNA ligase subunit beta [Stellaceae bacterium]|nr:glycine--tRNA ligase subunit beta [Stellaceae bacterium]